MTINTFEGSPLTHTFVSDYQSDPQWSMYGDNSLLIYAMSLYLSADDPHELAAESLTDGPNDKKIDFLWLDLSERRCVVAQGYLSSKWGKPEAQANKAADLNTAAAWLLSAPIDQVPERIRLKADELRKAISDDLIGRIEFIYAHNCYASENVTTELNVVAQKASDALPGRQISVSAHELGLDQIEALFLSNIRDILVTDLVEIPKPYLEIKEDDNWQSIVTSISGTVLFDLYKKHGEKLFSANVREYLGSRSDKRNINNGIITTTTDEPKNFFVYNNGLTLLTERFTDVDEKKFAKGVSIVNGAQTTGAIFEAGQAAASNCSVLARFIYCPDKVVVGKVVKYNNTQNGVKAFDRKSNDEVQKRLTKDFNEYGIAYIARRGNYRSSKNALTAESTGQVLAAFHNELSLATRNRADVFESDSTYRKIFPSTVSAEHIYLLHCFSRAIDEYKWKLKTSISDDTATASQISQYELLSFSASKSFILFLIGNLAEQLVGAKIADKYNWKAKRELITINQQKLIDICFKVIEVLVPLAKGQISGSAYDTARSATEAKALAMKVSSMLEAGGTVFAQQLSKLRQATTIG